ncbi:MAG: alkaline phosphatase [Bacteroidales bacterium]|nr:alkaline phosphatase [Bacteroidales bacterium]
MRPRILLLLLATLFVFSSCCITSEKKAKYVFYFIGDGMGFSHIALAEAYNAAKDGKIGSEPLCFTQFPVMGMATSYSASNMITCSSAAGTALSTGFKTNNGMLGVAPDTTELESIAYKIHDAGYKVGIMTSVTIDHATPGAFYANSAARSDYYAIAAQLPESGFEFFGGGGFQGLKKEDGRKPIYEIVAENGYEVAFGKEEYEAKKESAEKIIYFQNKERAAEVLPYAFLRGEGDISLADVVTEAIEFLDNDKGFFIMAEGGQIDWAAHANDITNTIHETIDFDEAIQVAYEFYLKHPDETLVVVTADHETGGVTLGRTKGYTFDLSLVPEKALSAKTDSEKNVENYMQQYPADSLSKAAKIGWTTSSHTGGAIPVFAIGAGSSRFAGRADNTDIPKRIISAMGIEW